MASPVGSVSGLLDRKFSRLGRGHVKVIKFSLICVLALLLTCYGTTPNFSSSFPHLPPFQDVGIRNASLKGC